MLLGIVPRDKTSGRKIFVRLFCQRQSLTIIIQTRFPHYGSKTNSTSRTKKNLKNKVFSMYMYTHARSHTHIHINILYLSICVCVCAHIYIYLHIYRHTHTYIHTYIYISIYYLYIYIYTYIYKYICVNTPYTGRGC